MVINRHQHPGIRSRTRGFTLIELVVVVSIMAILLGAAVPMASMVFKSKAIRATREALDELSGASAEYFHDTFTLPASPLDLHVDPGAPGWTGPYMLTATSDAVMGITDSALDAWGNQFRFVTVGDSLLSIESAGEDGTFGTAADVTVALDVTSIRRRQTLEELRIVNQAVTLYNGVNLPDTPLPASYPQILNQLVLAGLLPNGNSYATDGWGDAYATVPAGAMPVVEIGSTHISSVPETP